MGIASLNAILRKAVLPGTVGADSVRDSDFQRNLRAHRNAPSAGRFGSFLRGWPSTVLQKGLARGSETRRSGKPGATQKHPSQGSASAVRGNDEGGRMAPDRRIAQDSPLSRLRERVGERALLSPTPASPETPFASKLAPTKSTSAQCEPGNSVGASVLPAAPECFS